MKIGTDKLLIKIFIAVAAVICLGLIPFGKVYAEEEFKIVYTQVPEDWQAPCLWAWGEDGTNAFEAWPGEAMKEDTNNKGWYYCYVPSFVSSIIINANEGTVQTSDLATESRDVWVTVESQEKAEASFEQLTTGDKPEYTAQITVYAQLPADWEAPCLWAWSAPDGTNVYANWPGEEMQSGTDGWFAMKIPAWVNSVILNANAGSVQTADISIESKNAWIVVEDAENYTLSYEKPVVEVPAEDMIKVHAKVPADWLMPCLWAWSAPDGTNVFANWPGQEMETEGDWYTYSVPNWVNSIIVNGTLGEVQTTDIAVEPKDVWVVITDVENYEVFYEEPAVTAPAEVQEDTAESPAVPEEVSKAGNSNILIIVIVAVVVVAAGGTGIYVYRRKKQ